MNTVVKTDKFNNVWIIRTPGGRFFVQVRLPGNHFRKLPSCRKWLAEIVFNSAVEHVTAAYS